MDSSYLGSASHSCSLLRPCSKIFTNKNVMTEVFRDMNDIVCHWVSIFWHIFLLDEAVHAGKKGLTETWLMWVVAGHGEWSANHQAAASIRLCKTVISTYFY